MAMAEPRDLFSETGCSVKYIPGVLSPAEAAQLFDDLRSLSWRREVDDFGVQSRETLYFADPRCDFVYVGLHLRPRRWPVAIARVRSRVAEAVGASSDLLSGCLLNNYRASEGSIPWHWDEVRAHGEKKVIATLSLGGRRIFRMRRRGLSTPPMELELEPGSVLVMAGRTQEVFEHELPLRSEDPHRISLTFRSIVPGYEADRDAYYPCTTTDCYERPARRQRR